MKYYIVWNADKTEGFVTNDEGLAYEVRKSSNSNCYTKDGERSIVAQEFCNVWCDDDCTIEEVNQKQSLNQKDIKCQ